MHLRIFQISTVIWTRAWSAFIWKDFFLLYPRIYKCFFAKFGWKWLVVLEIWFNISSIFFSLFPYYFPLKKGVVIHLIKLDFSLSNDAFCQVCMKLASGSGDLIFKCICTLFLLQFLYYLPLEKSWTLGFHKLEFPLSKDIFAKIG